MKREVVRNNPTERLIANSNPIRYRSQKNASDNPDFQNSESKALDEQNIDNTEPTTMRETRNPKQTLS